MTAAFLKRRVSLSVGWRLGAGLFPAILAVALVAGLFYYGELGRAAPRLVLVVAAALTVASLGLTWMNARYFVNRIGRLARVTGGQRPADHKEDEFDRIEHVVDTLGTALSAAEAERSRVDAVASAQRRDEATMLAGVVADTLARLDEVRIPLHILLEAPFGELNENQEELLRDARTASDAMDAALRRLAQVADVDRGAFAVQQELVQINDVVRSVLPLARAAAERRGARVETALEPGLPRVMADRARLAEALALLMSDAAELVEANRPLVVETVRDGAGAIIRIAPVPQSLQRDHGNDPAPAQTAKEVLPDHSRAVTSILAERLIAAQHGRLALTKDALELRVGGV